MAWYVYLLLIIVIFVAGWTCSWLFFKNNPKYLRIDKMALKKRDELFAKVEEYKKKFGVK